MAKILHHLRRLLLGLCLGWGFLSALLLLPPQYSPLTPWNRFLTGAWSDTAGDTLVVLGAEEIDGHLLGLHSYWRTAYAVYEWRQGHYRNIVFSGEGLSGPMRDFAIGHGIPTNVIQLEDHSHSTRQQAEAVTALLRQPRAQAPGNIILLTSDFHSRRATAAFRRCGLAVQPRPVPDAGKRMNSWTQRWDVFLDLTLETVKSAYYQWRGWLA